MLSQQELTVALSHQGEKDPLEKISEFLTAYEKNLFRQWGIPGISIGFAAAAAYFSAIPFAKPAQAGAYLLPLCESNATFCQDAAAFSSVGINAALNFDYIFRLTNQLLHVIAFNQPIRHLLSHVLQHSSNRINSAGVHITNTFFAAISAAAFAFLASYVDNQPLFNVILTFISYTCLHYPGTLWMLQSLLSLCRSSETETFSILQAYRQMPLTLKMQHTDLNSPENIGRFLQALLNQEMPLTEKKECSPHIIGSHLIKWVIFSLLLVCIPASLFGYFLETKDGFLKLLGNAIAAYFATTASFIAFGALVVKVCYDLSHATSQLPQ